LLCSVTLATLVGSQVRSVLEEVDNKGDMKQEGEQEDSANSLVQQRPRKWWHWSADPRFNRQGNDGLETQFSHWLDKWHHDHPDSTESEEANAWHERQKEIQRMFDWEAEERQKLQDEEAREAAKTKPIPDADHAAEARYYDAGIAFNPLGHTRYGRDPIPDDPVPGRHPPATQDEPAPVRTPPSTDNEEPWHGEDWDEEAEGDLPGWDELIKDRHGRGHAGGGRPGSAEDFVASQFGDQPEPAVPHFEQTPETIIAPPPGPPDFNGHDAIIASHPDIGYAPTELEEGNMETRGSFTVQLARTGYMRDGEVAMSVWGPPSEFKCTIRGYRKLSNDFQGNSVYTGFKKSWVGERKLSTGYISPGVTNEYDIMDCRSEVTGETQYFRISFGTDGFDDLRDHGPPNVLGDHFGANIDSVTFDMDRPTFEDEQATQAYYRDYDVAADNKPFK